LINFGPRVLPRSHFHAFHFPFQISRAIVVFRSVPSSRSPSVAQLFPSAILGWFFFRKSASSFHVMGRLRRRWPQPLIAFRAFSSKASTTPSPIIIRLAPAPLCAHPLSCEYCGLLQIQFHGPRWFFFPRPRDVSLAAPFHLVQPINRVSPLLFEKVSNDVPASNNVTLTFHASWGRFKEVLPPRVVFFAFAVLACRVRAAPQSVRTHP